MSSEQNAVELQVEAWFASLVSADVKQNESGAIFKYSSDVFYFIVYV